MKTGKHEAMQLPESPKRAERQVPIGDGGQLAGVAEETFSGGQGARKDIRPDLDSSGRTYLRELAGATACLQRLLADVYPELARIQR